MDRKGWIILILCSIALVLNFNMMRDNNAKQAKLDREKKELADAKESEVKAISTTSDTSSESSPLQVEKTDELFAVTDGEQVIKYTFSNLGGGIKTAEMLNEDKVFKEGEKVTINEFGDNVIGALAKSYKDVEKTFYERIDLTKNSITYRGKLEDGVSVTKLWALEEGTEDLAPKMKLTVSFKTAEGRVFDLNSYSITTGSSLPVFVKEQINLAGWFYYQDGDYENEDHGNFTGGWFSDAKAVDQIKVENLEYFGVNSQFFGTAIFPLADAKSNNLWASGEEIDLNDGKKKGKRWKFVVGLDLPEKTMSAGETASISYDIFVGAKKNQQMAALSENSDDIMNFSMFSIFAWISDKMNSVLNWIHGWFSEDSSWSWGIAIILLTIFIRIIIWPLHQKSTRTMKRMGKLQPIMKDIREKYKDNPQKLNQETMKLYRDYGVNPMGGCLPMLVQIPIFFSLVSLI